MKQLIVLSLAFLSIAAAADQSCSPAGEYVWGNDCCPGLSQVRVSNDGFICMPASPIAQQACSGLSPVSEGDFTKAPAACEPAELNFPIQN